jgi:hypothetical protein
MTTSLTVADPGDPVTVTGTWTASGPISSASVAVTIKKPDGTTESLSVVTNVVSPTVTATATYIVPAANTEAGMHYVRWVVSGELIAADPDMFWVRRSKVLA